MDKPIIAETRDNLSRSATRKLRKNGRVPGIIYGGGINSQPVHVDEIGLRQTFRDQGINQVLRLKINEDVHDVMVYELQRDPLKGNMLHIDFKKVALNEPLDTNIPVQMIGEAEGVKDGGVLQQQLRELNIRCLPDKIPEVIEVDIHALNIGDNITVGDIEIPEGIEVQHENDEVIVSILSPRLDPIDKAEEDPGEPEVVGAKDGPGIDEAK